tara:strand:- start:541 stop:714 length:174 start_codon:yes stop_codon:yes gene_type:complete
MMAKKNYRVEVVQTNVFYIKAKNEDDARNIAAEHRFWDNHVSYPDSYGVHFNIEEDE